MRDRGVFAYLDATAAADEHARMNVNVRADAQWAVSDNRAEAVDPHTVTQMDILQYGDRVVFGYPHALANVTEAHFAEFGRFIIALVKGISHFLDNSRSEAGQVTACLSAYLKQTISQATYAGLDALRPRDRQLYPDNFVECLA